ncbi:hypothetical protein R5W24_003500 [Gemmata sp. JC717]|uniref:hypothetical protein n=1 Tax=Gemmata algarum TaxID=2975278 RepID=UPI0021BB0E53|nr:hypothetical protein [Gemmata algarum]MDY3554380.1 hypothetical protein [Gemmata algarum]
MPALIGLEATDVPVSVTGGVDRGGDLAVRADGSGFVVTYEAPDDAGGGIYFKRFDANWQLVQGPVAVNTVTANDQQAPSIGADSAGNFVIAWQSFGQDPGDSAAQAGVYARRFLADGTALDAAEFRVNTTTAGQQREPHIDATAGGTFLVTWTGTEGDLDPIGTDVYFKVYDSSGGVVVPERAVSPTAANNDCGKDRSELASFLAYNGFAGGVYVAAIDLDGDGRVDLVTGSAFGSPGGHVKVFDGSNLAQTASYLAYPSVFEGGARVGAADLNGSTALLIGTGPALTPRATAVDPLTGQIRAELLNTPAGAQRSVFVA